MDFYDELNAKLRKKREDMKEKYHRVLPTNELFFDRWEKAKYLNAGEGTTIYDTSIIMGDVKIGKYVWIGPYTLLEGSNAALSIGNHVSIDAGVMIYTHDSTKFYVSGGKNAFEKGNVSIGDNTVIGSMSMISCGVAIGRHCVIGAHSFVNCSIPDYSIAAGIPAKIIGKVVMDKEGNVHFVYSEKNDREEKRHECTDN
ncbi:acyltransferase [bacterium D16-50]|nr:acyltransferase [bacterium D16-50]